jgi:hypothetical protein
VLGVMLQHQKPLNCLCLFLAWTLFCRSFNECFLILILSAVCIFFYNENLPFSLVFPFTPCYTVCFIPQ